MTKEQKTKELAKKSFLLGVEWTLKMICKHQDIWNLDEQDAAIILSKARKLIVVDASTVTK